MARLEDLSYPTNELWAYSDQHGWVVQDDDDPRNRGQSTRTIIRCRDWAEIQVPIGEPTPAQIPFRIYLNSVGARKLDEEIGRLRALQTTYASRKREIIAIAQALLIGQRRLQLLERNTAILLLRAAKNTPHASLVAKTLGRELTYEELLETAEWRQRRVQVLVRDSFQCQQCGRDGSDIDSHILQVHHQSYDDDKLPWEYPDELLTTLCKDCHRIAIRPARLPNNQMADKIG